MIPRTRKVAEGTDNKHLTDEELNMIQSILDQDATLSEEIKLSDEIDEALGEKDVMLLRSKLKNITNQTDITSGAEHPTDAEAYFGLSEEVFKPVNLPVVGEEPEIGNYLQKLHLRNHTLASKEVVHDLFSDNEEVIGFDHQTMSPEDELLFEEIQEAVTEKEIIDLRANLQSIAQSVTIHQRTFEEIDEFVSGELDAGIENLIRGEANINSALSNEIELQREVNSAIAELDIMSLRNGLKEMMNNEYSHSRSIAEIDDYLNDDLDEMALAQFEEELMSNSGLSADVAFQKEIDKAVSEADVMAIRANLRSIADEEKGRKSEMLGVSPPKIKNLFWYAAASSIILMIAFSSLLIHKTYSGQQLYTSYYQPYKNGANIARSVSASSNEMNIALREIDKGDYTTALKVLQGSSIKDQDGFSLKFYSGVAYQELGDYKNAITSFTEVVNHGITFWWNSQNGT